MKFKPQPSQAGGGGLSSDLRVQAKNFHCITDVLGEPDMTLPLSPLTIFPQWQLMVLQEKIPFAAQKKHFPH